MADETTQVGADTSEGADKVQPDLEAARDAKCIPLAKATLNDFAVGLFPESGELDYPTMTKAGLERLLEADANVTTEVPYVYQLAFAGFGILNTAIQAAVTEPTDDARYGRIARQLLAILATANVSLTLAPTTPDDAELVPVKERVAALIAQEKLTSIEVTYIVGSILGAFNTAQNYAQMSIESSVRKAEEKLFAIADMSDLSMKKLDEVLKSE